MRREIWAHIVPLACFAVILAVAIASIFYLATGPGPRTVLIPAGTVIEKAGYTVAFTVSGGPGRLVGAWFANLGGIVSVYRWGPPVILLLPCIRYAPWPGSANVSLAPGSYTLSLRPGFSGQNSGTIEVSREIQVLYPGDAPGINGTILASWCSLY